MTTKKNSNALIKRGKRLLSTWGEDFVDAWFPFPVLKPTRLLYQFVLGKPRVLTREDLYEFGLRMLKRGRKSLVAVNTVGREDSPNFFTMPGHMQEKRYYEHLFRIVEGNRHGVGTPLAVRRYMDLADVNKCEEAISLL